jgi:hypothetical protein
MRNQSFEPAQVVTELVVRAASRREVRVLSV